MPTLLATSPFAATRSNPVTTACAAPVRRSPAAAASTSSACSIPSRCSSHTVSRAPCSSGRASHASTCTGRRSASSAITPRPVPRPEAASAPELQCVITVTGPGGSTVSSASAPWRASAALAASSSRWIASAAARAASGPSASTAATIALDRPAEVARRRPGAGEDRGAALERLGGRRPRDLHRQAVGGGDADQRGAADRQPADRRRRVLGAGERQHDLLGRQPRLVEHVQRGAVPAQRRRGVEACGGGHRARC